MYQDTNHHFYVKEFYSSMKKLSWNTSQALNGVSSNSLKVLNNKDSIFEKITPWFKIMTGFNH